MDSDDICDLKRFEKQILFFQKNPKISILGTGVEIFSEKNENSKTKIIKWKRKKRNNYSRIDRN